MYRIGKYLVNIFSHTHSSEHSWRNLREHCARLITFWVSNIPITLRCSSVGKPWRLGFDNPNDANIYTCVGVTKSSFNLTNNFRERYISSDIKRNCIFLTCMILSWNYLSIYTGCVDMDTHNLQYIFPYCRYSSLLSM